MQSKNLTYSGSGIHYAGNALDTGAANSYDSAVPMQTTNKHMIAGVLLIAAHASVFGQAQPYTQAGTGQPAPSAQTINASANPSSAAAELDPLQKLMDNHWPEFIARGKFDLDVRLRFEDTHEHGLKSIRSEEHTSELQSLRHL